MSSDIIHQRLGEVTSTIRAEMGRRSISQSQLAEAIGVSQVAVSKKLRCAAPITVQELLRIAAFLQVPVSELLATKDAA